MSPRRAWKLAAPLALLLTFLLTAAAAEAAVRATPIASGFDTPVLALGAPADPHRLYVVEQRGRIQVLRDGARTAAPFLDIVGDVRFGGEQGFLSLAFAPDYATSGKFYVYYTAPRPNDSGGSIITIDEFTRSAADPDRADPATRRNVMRIDHPNASNHNGGTIMFGPDGYLYITTGDGGAGDDPPNNAQNLTSLLGKVLRIDPLGGSPYAIPPGNPFAAGPDNARDEVYAYGLRNPFRASFDRQTGDLTIGDVGQDRAEEVDFAPRGTEVGANYGWRCVEGFQRTSNPCDPASLTGAIDPVLEQDRSTGFCAIIGGVVVRDPSLAELAGRYVYGDNCQAQLRSAVLQKPRATDDRALGVSISQLSGFGEDSCGHVYLTSLGGGVWRLDGDAPPAPCPEPGTADTTAPVAKLSRARSQRVLRQKGFVVAVTCNEACGFTATGKMRVSGSRTRYGLKRSSKLANAGQRVRVRLALSKKGTATLRRTLARRRRASATVTILARDASGNQAARKVSIRVKR
jgi:glucose/arabinose dehydrogenase